LACYLLSFPQKPNEIRAHHRGRCQWPRQRRHRQQYRRRPQGLWPSRHFHQNRFSLSLSLNFLLFPPFPVAASLLILTFSTAPMQIRTWTSTPAPCLPSSTARFLFSTTAERFILLLLVFVSPLHALISMSPRWCSISTLCVMFWLGERLIWIWEITSASSMSRLPRITTSPLEKYTRCMLAFALLYLCNGYGTLQGAREWFCFCGLTVSFRVTSLFSRRNVKEII